jgi:hypothetical protein
VNRSSAVCKVPYGSEKPGGRQHRDAFLLAATFGDDAGRNGHWLDRHVVASHLPAHNPQHRPTRQMRSGVNSQAALVFADPVGVGSGADRPPLFRHLYRHVYPKAANRLTDPTRDLPLTRGACSRRYLNMDHRRSRSSATASARLAASCARPRFKQRYGSWKRRELWSLAPMGMA